MPPSPALRRSPGKGFRADSHKRGRSLESGLSFKERDDDLALFSEMHNKEEDNFLLQSTEDLNDILATKLKPLHDLKLGITIPSRGESSDLLNIDGDKNDYDWLLTPPDTPLFPCLDDEPPPTNLVYSGRPRSRPISISRSPTMEKTYGSSRGSASPRRSSQSPCSSASTTLQSRGRPYSAPRSSPSPTVRHRASPPPVKPSTPPRRASVSGSVTGVRVPSPVRPGRGNSSSPKVRAWKSNIPGFSLEAPPNLRTSLADRPASYVRGSSPASRNTGGRSSSNFRRQSMSPTATRSISSSHSHDRDQFSSHSKGSVASSVDDDDADSFLSPLVSGLHHNLSESGSGGFPSNKPVTFSKKPTKISYPSSAPKRSFDSAIRQMDKRSPQNMFRPLLSSVPSTTFYGGKASSSHRTMISINSPLTTTSSNASSDRVTSGAPDTEGSEHNQEDVEGEFGKISYTGGHEEVFTFDKMDTLGEDSGVDAHDCLSDVQPDGDHKVFMSEFIADEMDGYYNHDAGAKPEAHQEHYVDGYTLLCSRCGCRYNFSELMEDDMNLCGECKQKEGEVTSFSELRVGVPLSTSDSEAITSAEVETSNASKPSLAAHDFPKILEMGGSAKQSHIIPDGENDRETKTSCQELRKNFLDVSDGQPVLNTSELIIPDVEICEQHTTFTDGNSLDNYVTGIDVTEGAGISVLLSNRPSSGKGPVIQGRSFTATAVSYDVRSYTRDSTASMRSSFGCGSVSTSSSIDMSSKYNEMPIQRQFSAKKSDISSKPESIGSSFSQTSSYISQGLNLVVNTHEENLDSCSGNGSQIATEGPKTLCGSAIASEDAEMLGSEGSLLIKDDDRSSKANGDCGFEMSSGVTQSEDNSSLQLAVQEDGSSRVVDNPLQTSTDISDSSTVHDLPVTEESNTDRDKHNQREDSAAPNDDHASMPEVEYHECHPGSPGSRNGKIYRDASEAAILSNDQGVQVVHEILCEPTVMLKDEEGRHARSLTLEEATETILLCTSIIHELAYKAATVAIDKEREKLAPAVGRLTPTITSSGFAPDPHGGSTRKRSSKSVKSHHRREETDTGGLVSALTTETDDVESTTTPHVSLPHKVDSMKPPPPPPKLESKCNCSIM